MAIRMTQTEEDRRAAYSFRLKQRDLRRWNRAQVLIAQRLGIRRDLNAVLALGMIFATIADTKHRPARFAEVRVRMEQSAF